MAALTIKESRKLVLPLDTVLEALLHFDGKSHGPLSRGDELATGVAKTTLPDKPQVLWKFSTGKNSVEATPAIVDGIVYIGDMQEKL